MELSINKIINAFNKKVVWELFKYGSNGGANCNLTVLHFRYEKKST